MARFKESRNSFLSGEVSPRVYGRTDLPEYKNGCEQILNAIVYPQGGVGRRVGSYIFNSTLVAAQDHVRLIPLKISNTLAYVIVFTTETLTFDSSGNILTGIYIINAATGTIGTLNYGFKGIVNATAYTGISVYTYLPQIQYTQQGTAIFFSHQSFPPFAIETISTNNFRLLNHWAFAQLGRNVSASLVANEVALSWPYDTRNLTSDTMQLSAVFGSGVTLTTSNSSYLSQPGIVGSTIRMTDTAGTKTGVAIITAITGTFTATVDVLVIFASTASTTNWAFSQWNGATGKAYPRGVACFEQRLYLGGNNGYPTGVWGSEIGNLANFRQEHYIDDTTLDVVNSDPYNVILAASDLSIIQWLSAGKTLVVGSMGSEIIGQGPDDTNALGPLNVGFVPQTVYGSSQVQPVRAQNTVRFVTRSGEKVRELNFNVLEDTYKAPELTQYAEHCTRRDININSSLDREINQIVEICHQEADNGITWCKTLDNTIFGVTRDRDTEEINAFHFHTIGGSYNNGTVTREAQVLSMCVIPAVNALGNHDDLWIAVKRTINGTSQTYIEVIGKDFQADTMLNASTLPQNKPIYCDSAKFYKGSPAFIFTAAHLPNTLVEVIADGIYMGQMTTDGSGNITLSKQVSEVIMGLPYRTVIKTLNLEAGSVVGSAQGTTKKIDEVDLRFYRTIGAKFGPGLDQLQTIDFRQTAANIGDPIALFSGDKNIKFPAGYHRKAYVYVVQDLPLPFQLTSIISRGITND
jgi:hypothetical protein